MKKIICVIIAAVLLCGCTLYLCSCGENAVYKFDHVDYKAYADGVDCTEEVGDSMSSMLDTLGNYYKEYTLTFSGDKIILQSSTHTEEFSYTDDDGKLIPQINDDSNFAAVSSNDLEGAETEIYVLNGDGDKRMVISTSFEDNGHIFTLDYILVFVK